MELKFNIVNPIASTGEMFCEPIFTDIAQDISFINEKGFFFFKKSIEILKVANDSIKKKEHYSQWAQYSDSYLDNLLNQS